MKMRVCFFLLFVCLNYEILSIKVSPETDCYNKGFICYDEDRFYQCVDIGNKTVTMGEPQYCPKGLKCNDDDEIECEEPWLLENFADYDSVIIQDSTSTSILTTNDIQSEPNLTTEEELEIEFSKLTITTERVTELPPLENNEFVDVLTTKLPVPQETDESFGWNESVNEENGSTIETETVITDTPEDADYDYIYDFWNGDVTEEYSTTTSGDTLTINEEKVTVSTSKAKPSTDGLIFHDVSFSTMTDYNSITEGFASSPENILSDLNTPNFNFITEQNENSVTTEKNEITLNLETQDEIEIPVSYEWSTSKPNSIVPHQTLNFQLQSSASTTTENKSFAFDTEATTAGFILTQENGMLTESVDNKERSTETKDESIESTTSLLYYTDDSVALEKFVDSTTFETTGEFVVESSTQTISGAVEESPLMKIEETQREVSTSDTTLLVESDEISEESTTAQSDFEHSTTLTDENQYSQSTLKTYTTSTEITKTIEDDVNMTRPTTDTTKQQESEVFETSTQISITTLYTTEASTSFTSGIFTKELITTEKNIPPDETSDQLLTLTTETITVFVESGSIINEKDATEMNTEGLSSAQTENDLLPEEKIHDNIDTSTTSEVNMTESSRVKANEFNQNVTSETVGLSAEISTENSTYLPFDFSEISLPSSTLPQTDNTESTIYNKEAVEVDDNFTDKDALSTTETYETFSSTDLLLTSSNEVIDTINNSVLNEELEVTTKTTSSPINYKNSTKLSVEIEKDSIFDYEEISTMEAISNGGDVFEESTLPESESTTSDAATTSSTEMPGIFTTQEKINTETSDTGFSLNGFFSTVAPDSSFTCSSVGKFPDPKSCSKFYLCINAFIEYITIALDCPKGTSFDSVVKECTRRPVQCPGETPLTCPTSGVYPHPTDCSRYYKCLWRSFNKNFILKQFKCPRGTWYHPKNRRCERATETECANSFVPEIAEDISFRCVEVGRFAVESSCREYYECKEKNGKIILYRKSCSESKLFDAEWGRCRKSHLVVCPFGDYDSRDSSEIDDRSVECR